MERRAWAPARAKGVPDDVILLAVEEQRAYFERYVAEVIDFVRTTDVNGAPNDAQRE